MRRAREDGHDGGRGGSDVGSVVQEGLSKKMMSGVRSQTRGRELREELCKQREQQVQRPPDGNAVNVFKKQKVVRVAGWSLGAGGGQAEAGSQQPRSW